MNDEQQVKLILDQLRQHAVLCWGEADAERQMDALQETAEQLAVIRKSMIEPDGEPRFY